jgi:hypothetical protein
VNVAAHAAANGRAIVTWKPGPGNPTYQYVIQSREGGQVVAQQAVAGTDATVAGLSPAHTYDFAVIPSGPQGTGNPGVSNAILAVGAVAPGPVTALTAGADASTNRVTVQWVPPPVDPVPETYDIGVWENYQQVGAFVCYAPCNQRTVDLTPGALAWFTVDAANPVGRSPALVSNPVTVTKSCPVACVSVDATATSGGATRRGAGFLNSIGPTTDPNVIAPLHPSQWRVAMVNRQGAPQYAAATGARVTELLSGDWWEATKTGQGAAEPWADWDRYTTFIRNMMQWLSSLGTPIAYWDVQNEPGAGGYYASGVTPTVDQLLTQYKIAYQTIKSVDPNAKVVAPSLVTWRDRADQSPGQLDMRTFLDYAVLNGIKFDAVSYHDISYNHRPDEYARDWWGMQPDEVNRSVDRLRQLIADRPSLGNPKILVNEYGDPSTSTLPGWSLGRVAALESANVDEANRACWSTCADGFLDGLLSGDGRTTMPNYWVYAFYASMAGNRARATSTVSSVTAFAATDESQTTRVLVGRHEGCRPDLATCPNEPAVPTGDVTLSVRVPFTGNAAVTLAAVPAGNAPLAGPVQQQQVTGTVASDGTLQVVLPKVADGDVWQATVKPA